MSDMTTSVSPSVSQTAATDAPRMFKVDETHWGYVVTSTSDTGRRIAFAQTVSMLIGAAFLAAAIGMWLMPAIMLGSDALFMRLFSTIVFVCLATLFLWHSSRGAVSEIQIDNSRGEIREVIRNHTGRTSLVSCHGFDAVGGVFMEPGVNDPEASLVLQYRNSGEILTLASGTEQTLSPLCDRINRDVVVGSSAA